MTPVYASMFTHYLAAKTEAEAARVVRTITRQIETGRGYNHWQGISNALVCDRTGARNGEALVDAVARAKPREKASYGLAAEKWAQLAPWWDGLQHERMPGERVQIGNLAVRVPRLCAERHPDGELEVLYPQWNMEVLPRHVVFGVMRIVHRAYPDATITFVDVPRLVTYSSRERDLTAYDEWLTVAGTELAELLPDVEGQAQAA
jgi:hypothetical protein